MNSIFEILNKCWDIYLDVAPYMLFGFFIAGLLHVFFKPDWINKYLGNSKIRPVFLSALLGVPLPLCSCGVVPVAVGLKKQGANNGAALSFMIATPETGVDSLFVSWAMLDPVMTILRPVAAFVTAVATGITQNFFGINHSPEMGSEMGRPDSPDKGDKSNKIADSFTIDNKGG